MYDFFAAVLTEGHAPPPFDWLEYRSCLVQVYLNSPDVHCAENNVPLQNVQGCAHPVHVKHYHHPHSDHVEFPTVSVYWNTLVLTFDDHQFSLLSHLSQ
jgi:hypothetical protein